MLKPLALLAAALPLLAFATLPAEAISKSTVRASGNIPIYAGPGMRYRVIGKLMNGERVYLSTCTRESLWCKIVNDNGPDGWVRGSSVVGSAAKVNVTPPSFENDPFLRGYFLRSDRDRPHRWPRDDIFR